MGTIWLSLRNVTRQGVHRVNEKYTWCTKEIKRRCGRSIIDTSAKTDDMNNETQTTRLTICHRLTMGAGIVLTLLILLPSVATAQPRPGKLSVLPRVGLTMAKLSDMRLTVINDAGNETRLSPSFKAGVTAGADIEYQLTDIVALSVGAAYSMQGCRYKDYQTAGSEDKTYYGTSDHHISTSYLNIPIMASVYVAKDFAVKIGVQPGFALEGYEKYEQTYFTMRDDGYKDYDATEKYKNDLDMESFDIAIPVGVSYEYMNVMLDARYNIGLKKVFKDGKDSKNNCFTLTVGYRFTL